MEALISPASFAFPIMIGAIIFKIIVVVSVIMLCVAYATYAERKVIGHMQVRMGPMRVGWHGLLQPIADGVKLFFKEDIIPAEADKPVFFLSPVISLICAMTSLAVLPFAEKFFIADINIGLLFLFAMSAIGTYGLVMSGWASNSKYAFLGGLRSSAQVISYEIALGLSLVGVMIMAGSLNLNEIIIAQKAYPMKIYLFPQILGAFVFFIAALAETNRAPFDLPEAETELVAGYFTEYSGFRFSLFFMAEYIAMIIMAAIWTVCFMGGWQPWIGPDTPALQPVWFMGKVLFFMFIYYWVRATLPRYRYDQLMNIGWKVLIPLALLNIVITATVKIYLSMKGAA
jgi:NADH-quinone oxidoreductase subunit H